MSKLNIFMLGKFNIQRDHGPRPELKSGRVVELLCYLLLNRERPLVREVVADNLWSDMPANQSRSYLRKTLWQLQTALEYGEERKEMGIILADQDWLQINPMADYWLDVAKFEQAFNLVRGVAGRNLDQETARWLEQSTKLYKGNLLENLYSEWIIYERERLQYHFLAMTEKLLSYYEIQGDYEKGIMFGEKILRLDRARERTHRRMMRLYSLLGDRTSAIRQYDRCVAALAEELEVEPSRNTRLLWELIRDDRFVSHELTPIAKVKKTFPDEEKYSNIPDRFPRSESEILAPDSIEMVLNRLLYIDNSLTLIHRRIHREIGILIDSLKQDKE